MSALRSLALLLVVAVGAPACGRRGDAAPAPAGPTARGAAPARPAARASRATTIAKKPAAEAPAPWPWTSRAVTAERAIVVSEAPLATRVGVEVLRAGGNAADAAIAVAFALAVVFPEAGNLGGGGFAVLRTSDGKNAALDFREIAPGRATRDMYLGPDGEPTRDSLVGHRAAAVPGTVAGLWALHRRHGTRPWAELVEPAIRLARDGFVVDESLAGSIAQWTRELAAFPASAALFLPGGRAPAAGTKWRNPDLAETLSRLARRGPRDFYAGRTARLIAAEMKRGGGLISLADLRRYRARWRTPIEFGYRDATVISMPPPSSGGITLAEAANILEGYDLRAMGWHSPAHLHVVAEALRRAFADRNAYLGDPDYVRTPRELVSDEYAARRRQSIDLRRASRSAEVGGGLAEGGDTTHFAVIDEKGMAVAITTTINARYGSMVTVAGAGFLLNDEMDDFTAKPGSPNKYGAVQGTVNAIAPGKRPLSSMTPTLVVRDGRVVLVVGARGGTRIISAVLQVLSNVVDFGMDVARAVDAPRVHHQHLPDVVLYEPHLDRAAVQGLRAVGHALDQASGGPVGIAPTIARQGDGWAAVPDPRRGGEAAGY